MRVKSRGQGIQLGELQEQWETARRAAVVTERALERAQDARDKAQAAAADAGAALKQATRAVLG